MIAHHSSVYPPKYAKYATTVVRIHHSSAFRFVSVLSHGAQFSQIFMNFQGSRTDLEKQLANSTTLYIGNMSFYTTEEQIFELFSRAGDVKRIIMGLDRFKKTPCGFCFVEYYSREDAENSVRYVSGTRLDDRIIRADWDAGFEEGRQYGRGKSGGQVMMK